MNEVESSGTVSKLPLVIAGGVVAIVLVVTIGLVAVRDPTVYEPGTPEAAVQNYVQASIDDDTDVLLSMLTEDLRGKCEADLTRWGHGDRYDNGEFRVELGDIEITQDAAIAELTFRYASSNGPFGGSGHSRDHQIFLVRIDDVWLVERATWPDHLAYYCAWDDR